MADWKDKGYDEFMNREPNLSGMQDRRSGALSSDLAKTPYPDGTIPPSALQAGQMVGDFRITDGSIQSRDYKRAGTGWRLNSDGTVDGITATATAGGNDTEIQFNNNGVLAGSPDMVWDGSWIILGNGGIECSSGIICDEWGFFGDTFTGYLELFYGDNNISLRVGGSEIDNYDTDGELTFYTSMSGGVINSDGIIQKVAKRSIYNNTPTELKSAAILMRSGDFTLIEARVLVHVRTDNTMNAYIIRNLYKNIGGTITLVDSQVAYSYEEDATLDFSLTIVADGAKDYIVPLVTGSATKTTRWLVHTIRLYNYA